MALIACTECGKQISDKAAACPHCGAPVVAAKAAKKPFSLVKWLFIGFFGLVVFQCVKHSTDSPSSSAASRPAAAAAQGMSSIDALLLCQTALKRVSKDPEKAQVPYVKDFGKGTESYFAWGADTKMARMRNGLGLEVAASASCIVDRSSKRITSLTLNGQSIL